MGEEYSLKQSNEMFRKTVIVRGTNAVHYEYLISMQTFKSLLFNC